MMNLRHVAAHHDVRQSARAGERPHVIIGRLRVPFVAEGQLAIQEMLTRFRRDLDQLGDVKFFSAARASLIFARSLRMIPAFT
jgi:hypothetical protein